MAVTVIGLIQGIQTARGLIALVDQDQISSSLADIEMSAARSAFAAIPRSVDKRAQIWTCIGHLNSAQKAYEHSIHSHVVVPTGTRSARDSDANVKRRFVLVLKAICYKYLGENPLCKEAIADSKTEVSKELSKTQGALGIAYALAGFSTGFLLAEFAYDEINGIGHADKEYGIDDDALSRIARILEVES